MVNHSLVTPIDWEPVPFELVEPLYIPSPLVGDTY